MNALFLKDLAEKTHRGLRGRVESGKASGGLCYGYRVVKSLAGGTLTTGERAIEPGEAAIVERIFREYVAGIAPKAIAKRLNQDGIAATSASRGDLSTFSRGCRSAAWAAPVSSWPAATVSHASALARRARAATTSPSDETKLERGSSSLSSGSYAFQACLIDRSSISPFRMNDLRSPQMADSADCDKSSNVPRSLTGFSSIAAPSKCSLRETTRARRSCELNADFRSASTAVC
jgi:Recombinase